jgi:hypothetical protein
LESTVSFKSRKLFSAGSGFFLKQGCRPRKKSEKAFSVIPVKLVPAQAVNGNPGNSRSSGLPPEFIPAKAGAGVTSWETFYECIMVAGASGLVVVVPELNF